MQPAGGRRKENHDVDRVGRMAKRQKQEEREKQKKEKEKKMNEMKICEKKYMIKLV